MQGFSSKISSCFHTYFKCKYYCRKFSSYPLWTKQYLTSENRNQQCAKEKISIKKSKFSFKKSVNRKYFSYSIQEFKNSYKIFIQICKKFRVFIRDILPNIPIFSHLLLKDFFILFRNYLNLFINFPSIMIKFLFRGCKICIKVLPSQVSESIIGKGFKYLCMGNKKVHLLEKKF